MSFDRRYCCVCAGKGIQRRALILTPEKRLPLCAEDAHKFWRHMNEEIVCRSAPKIRTRREASGTRGTSFMRQRAMNSVLGEKQRQVYEAAKFLIERGMCPKASDIVPIVGIPLCNVWTYVARLELHGFVTRVGKEIRLVNRSQEA